MKRWMLLLIAAIVLFTMSCSTEAPEVVPEYETKLSMENMEYDFYGYDFLIKGTAQIDNVFSLAPVYGETTRGDKILKRYADVGEKLNINITAEAGSDVSKIAPGAAAGLRYSDLLYVSISDTLASEQIQNGLFNNLTELGLDMNSGKYGTDEMIKAVTFNGGVYAFVPNYWGIPVFHTPHAMWINPSVLDKYQQPSPHELDEQGKWNWDSLENIVRNVFDSSDTDSLNWTYGMVYTNEQYLELSAIYANGGRLAEIDEATGKLEYALNSPNTIEALEWLASMEAEGIIKDGGDRQNIEPFMEGKYAFFFEYPWMGISTEGGPLATKMEDPYEWITFPIGPSGEAGSCPNVISYHSRFLHSPIGANLEVLPIAIELIFEPLDGEEETLWYDEFERMNFYSTKSFEYFVKMRNEAFWDYSSYTPYTGEIRTAISSIIQNKQTASQALSSIAEAVQECIDTKYNNYLN